LPGLRSTGAGSSGCRLLQHQLQGPIAQGEWWFRGRPVDQCVAFCCVYVDLRAVARNLPLYMTFSPGWTLTDRGWIPRLGAAGLVDESTACLAPGRPARSHTPIAQAGEE
jgi:hypothetical protein